MQLSHEKILNAVRGALLPFAEEGVSPDEIKQAIIYILSPHFVNQHVLHELAVDVLASEALNISRINSDAWTKSMFSRVLDDYQKAATLDKSACFSGCAEWLNKVLNSSSEYVSILNLNVSLDKLSLEDFRYEVFRSIGALIEACLQPYLKELLLQVRIRRGKVNPAQGLESMKLGVVVGELYDTSGYSELFAPLPWGIKLHQWRNMAQHHRTRVENNKIIGTYDVGNNEQEVTFTKEDLLSAFRRIHSILSILKGANSIFFIDNGNEIRPYLKNTANVRAEVKIFQIASALATQGFDLQDISIEEKSVTAIIKDVTDTPPNEQITEYKRKRMIHSTLFVYEIWFYFPVDTVKIKHVDKQDNLRHTIVGKGSDCEAISRGEIPVNDLFKKLIIA